MDFDLDSLFNYEEVQKIEPNDLCANFCTGAYKYDDIGVGIEFEMENCHDISYRGLHDIYSMVDDGSLRNYGIEIVTLPFVYGNGINVALSDIYKLIGNNPEIEFTPRTSTHVHVSVRDFTTNQFKLLNILYVLFENVLFSFAGSKRKESVFCVPTIGSMFDIAPLFVLEERYHNTISYINNCNKYSAFNVHPVKTYGTVEFRHLGGTDDMFRVGQWISALLSLVAFAKENELASTVKTILNLSSTSEYEMLYHEVFGNLALPVSDVRTHMRKGVSYLNTQLVIAKRNFAQTLEK